MSIATEITRLNTAKEAIKTAVEAKGVVIPSGTTLDAYDDYIEQISVGGAKWIDVTDEESGTTLQAIPSYITSVEIPSGITSIGFSAFENCSSLTSINIPSGVISIGMNAFAGCKSLSSIIIPSGVTIIENSTFNGCSSLTNIEIPSGVTTISGHAFGGNRSLTSITIPNSVTSIGLSAFFGCSSLTSITVNAVTPPTLSSSNVFQDTNDCPIYVPSESVDAYKGASNWSAYSSRIQAIPNN